MSIRLDWINELSDFDIPQQWISKLEQLLQIAAEVENAAAGVVSLSFVDDEAIRELNHQYRGIDRATDVLSFAMEDEEHDDPSIELLYGDIVISVPTAKAQSEEYKHSLEREIGFLFVHGFLHLMGHDHHDEASEKSMFALQEQILQKAGLNR